MLGMASVLGITLISCSQEAGLEPNPDNRQGLLTLTLNTNTGFHENADGARKTRAVNESAYENINEYTVKVTDKDGVQKLVCKGSELSQKMPIAMSIGSYSVEAFYGTESDASRDGFYVYGKTEGTIKADKKEDIEVTCTPTCGRITVNFEEGMSTYFADYNVVFTGTEALGNKTIAWLKDDTEPWYVKLKEGTEGETIRFTITTTAKPEYLNGNDEQIGTKNGSFKLARNKAYKMNIKPSYTPSTSGEVEIEISIIEDTNDKEFDIDVPVDWV